MKNRVWTKAEDEMMVKLWSKLEPGEIAAKLGRSETAVLVHASKIKLGPAQGEHRRWTEAEENKLSKLWGQNESIASIARRLKRTVRAVQCKVTRMGLSSRLSQSDGVAISIFVKTLLNLDRKANSLEIKRYVESGAPWFYCYIENNKYRIVNLDKFWKWAKEHPKVYDLSRMEFLSLGKEPDWMRDYRRCKSLEKAAKRWREFA